MRKLPTTIFRRVGAHVGIQTRQGATVPNNIQSLVHLAVATIGLSLAIGDSPAQAAPRPLSDFLAAQGTYCQDFDGNPGCDLFIPPEPNIIHWTGPAPTYNLTAVVDFAGLYNNVLVANGKPSLGTTVAGQVNERPLSNGRAEVHVALHTKNALTYVIEPTGSGFPVIYGRQLVQVLAGAQAALSTCSINLTFINTAPGAPLPDLQQVAFFPSDDQFLTRIGISCSGKGALASGQTASFVIRQLADVRKPDQNKFPVENITLHPLGGKSALEFRDVPEQ